MNKSEKEITTKELVKTMTVEQLIKDGITIKMYGRDGYRYFSLVEIYRDNYVYIACGNDNNVLKKNEVLEYWAYVKTFDSVINAEDSIGKCGIDSVLAKKTKTCGNYIWIYESDYLKFSKEETNAIVYNANKKKIINNLTQFKTGNTNWNKGKNGYKINGSHVFKFDLNGVFIKEFNSLNEAAESILFKAKGKETRGNPDLISRAIRKGNGEYKNFLWKFKKN